MDSETKEPDNEATNKPRRRSESFYMQAGDDIGLQLAVSTLEDGKATGETWILPITPPIERELRRLVKEQGAYIGPGLGESLKGELSTAKDDFERAELKRGDKYPCEVCGDPTYGIPTEGMAEHTIEAFGRPDAEGRVFLQGDVIAVCSKPECLDVSDAIWDAAGAEHRKGEEA